MLSQIVLTSLLAATALAAPNADGNTKKARIVHNARAPPVHCDFTDRVNKDIGYLELSDKACIGFQMGGAITCGKGAWSPKDYSDIKKVGSQQIAKDGFTESSQVDAWQAFFNFFTTAFGDSDAAIKAWENGMDNLPNDAIKEQRYRTFFYRYDSEDIRVEYDGGCPS